MSHGRLGHYREEIRPVSQKIRSRRFAAEVRSGRALHDALTDAYQHTPHAAVVAAGIAMLDDEGAIDMKRLAIAAGMSRASLYRYYPDRGELIAEIAARGLEELVAVLADHPAPHERLRAVGDFLLANRAYAIAMLEAAETASPEALDVVCELLVGDASFAPWFVGITAMCAGAELDDAELARVRRHIDEVVELRMSAGGSRPSG